MNFADCCMNQLYLILSYRRLQVCRRRLLSTSNNFWTRTSRLISLPFETSP